MSPPRFFAEKAVYRLAAGRGVSTRRAEGERISARNKGACDRVPKISEDPAAPAARHGPGGCYEGACDRAAEGFSVKKRAVGPKHWPACRLPSDKISPPKAACSDQNRPPPGGPLGSRVLEELAGAQRPANVKRPRPVGGNRPGPAAARANWGAARAAGARSHWGEWSGRRPSRYARPPTPATGAGYDVAETSTRCFTAARHTHAAVAAWPLPHSTSTASPVAAIAFASTRRSIPR
ncbi:hypothetical protein EGO52_17915 (plasmid) [Curtobacterium flaccumfaciens]|nr:hypothetical protein [Curtobacterium flaccumfaciens]